MLEEGEEGGAGAGALGGFFGELEEVGVGGGESLGLETGDVVAVHQGAEGELAAGALEAIEDAGEERVALEMELFAGGLEKAELVGGVPAHEGDGGFGGFGGDEGGADEVGIGEGGIATGGGGCAG
jgi:hypothetical protein